jgi:hypothetical protein
MARYSASAMAEVTVPSISPAMRNASEVAVLTSSPRLDVGAVPARRLAVEADHRAVLRSASDAHPARPHSRLPVIGRRSNDDLSQPSGGKPLQFPPSPSERCASRAPGSPWWLRLQLFTASMPPPARWAHDASERRSSGLSAATTVVRQTCASLAALVTLSRVRRRNRSDRGSLPGMATGPRQPRPPRSRS